mmetsp:Transcript_119989/g.384264  ORF Transcript_119989/g.384264 Transcript_119989/m.384264 type:complete len:489 (-) Transcript_119989:101-1567(-)
MLARIFFARARCRLLSSGGRAASQSRREVWVGFVSCTFVISMGSFGAEMPPVVVEKPTAIDFRTLPAAGWSAIHGRFAAASASAAETTAASAAGAVEQTDGGEELEVPNPVDVCDTAVCFFHNYVRHLDAFPRERFTKVRTIAQAQFGSVVLHEDLHQEGRRVVLKFMDNVKLESCRDRPANGRYGEAGEDGLTEIGVMRRLRLLPPCDFVLRMLDCFRDDARARTVVVTEYRGREFREYVNERGKVEQDNPLTERELVHSLRQLLSGVRYLHANNFGHRDICLENIVYDPADGRLVIIDFGMVVLCRTRDGRRFRYFACKGHTGYLAPEMFSPGRSEIRRVARPAGDAGSIRQLDPFQRGNNGSLYLVVLAAGPPNELCDCLVAGYEVVPVDMFAVGVGFFNIHVRKDSPWVLAQVSDQHFRYVFRNPRGILGLIESWRAHHGIQPLRPSLEALLQTLLQPDPARRCTAEEALANEAFAGGDGGNPD